LFRSWQEWLRTAPQPSCYGRPFSVATRANYESAAKEFGKVAATVTGGDDRWAHLKATSAPARHTVVRPRLNAESMMRLADAADRDRILNLVPHTVVETPEGQLSPQGRCLIWMMTRLLRRADDVCRVNVDDLTPVPDEHDPSGWRYRLTSVEKYGQRVQTDVPADVSQNLRAWMEGHRRQLVAFHGDVSDVAGDPLFIHPRLGRRMSRYVVARVVEEAGNLSGLTAELALRRPLGPNDLKSGGITWLLEQGYPVEDVMLLSHHTDPRTIARYRNDVKPPATMPHMRAAVDWFRNANIAQVSSPLAPPRKARPPRHVGCLCEPAWPQLVATVHYSDETTTVTATPAASPTPPWAADLEPRCAGCNAPYTGAVAVTGRLREVRDDEFAALLADGPDSHVQGGGA